MPGMETPNCIDLCVPVPAVIIGAAALYYGLAQLMFWFLARKVGVHFFAAAGLAFFWPVMAVFAVAAVVVLIPLGFYCFVTGGAGDGMCPY